MLFFLTSHFVQCSDVSVGIYEQAEETNTSEEEEILRGNPQPSLHHPGRPLLKSCLQLYNSDLIKCFFNHLFISFIFKIVFNVCKIISESICEFVNGCIKTKLIYSKFLILLFFFFFFYWRNFKTF